MRGAAELGTRGSAAVPVLEARGGNVSETAAELGVAASTLYAWRRRDSELARGFAELAQGREGSRRAAAAARRKARKKPL